MHLFIALVALAGCKVSARICVLLFLGYVYVAWFGHWDSICFFYGAVLAQMDILRQRKALPKDEGDDESGIEHLSPGPACTLATYSRTVSRYVRRLFASSSIRKTLYLLALYLMSFPPRGVKHPSLLYKDLVNPLIPYVHFQSAY